MTSKYRIEAVEIAGFKAFSTPQIVPINGKTTFIFGENSLGKSSIVEAIVWCLYGTETGVRNQLYKGPCYVNLYLTESANSSKISRIQRRMHQTDNESDVDVYSPDGTRKNITDFIPQLKKLEHGPGTRVIFAEQEPGRRYSHDLNNFEELIAAYLGLDIAYSLIDWLARFIDNQEAIFNTQVRSQEKEIHDEIQKRVQVVHERIKMITGQPPWDSKFPPSESETSEKVRSFFKNISSLLGEDNQTAPDTDLEGLLNISLSKLDQLENSSKASLEADAEALENKQKTVSALRDQLSDVTQQIKSLDETADKRTSQLAELLKGKSESALISEREQLLSSIGKLSQQLTLIQAVEPLVTNESQKCPVCNTALCADELMKGLQSLKSKAGEDAVEVQNRIDNINTLLENVKTIKKAIETMQISIGLRKRSQSSIETELSTLLGMQQVTIDALDAKLVELRRSLGDLQNKIQDATAKFVTLCDQLSKFQRAAEYHKLIRYLSRLDAYFQSEDHQKALEKIREFDKYMHSLKNIHLTLENAYVKAFSSYLPILSKEMTKVYCLLTKQKSFDAIRIIEEPGNPINKSKRKMVLQVGSPKRDVWVTPEKADVLNGQALSALNLVPYFAFAQMGMSKHEIDFLLIDDPSQSFDTSHVEYLLDILKPVADSAQVIIATHERDKFQGKVESLFKNYNIINVNSFNVDSGPIFSPVTQQD